MVGQDVMQPAEVSLKKGSLNDFSQFLLLWLMPPHLRFFMQRLARDVAEMVELLEEVT
jgi:hypothetical protein